MYKVCSRIIEEVTEDAGQRNRSKKGKNIDILQRYLVLCTTYFIKITYRLSILRFENLNLKE